MRLTESEYRKEELNNKEVKFQLDAHGCLDHEEFFNEVKHSAPFTGEEVLTFLGY